MLYRLLLATFVAASGALTKPTSGCQNKDQNPPWPAGQYSRDTIYSANGGGQREYLLHIPPNYKPNVAAPLIFSFHGANRDMYNQLSVSMFNNSDWNSNSISVYPNGLHKAWQGKPGHPPIDIPFTADLLQKLKGQLCIDDERVYASGKSVGGGFCNVIACDCDLSAQFTAIAPVSGAYYTTPEDEDWCQKCQPAHPMPILEIHGVNDTTIDYWGGSHNGVDLPSIPWFVGQWAVTDGVVPNDGIATTQPLPLMGFPNVTMYEYTTPQAGGRSIVQHYAIYGLPHWWPSTVWNADNNGNTTWAFVNATQLILAFFDQWTAPLQGTTTCSPAALVTQEL